MNKPLTIIVLVIVLLIGGSAAFLLTRDNAEPTASTTQPPAAQDTAANQSTTPGSYQDYSAGKLADTAGTKLLFFHAPWCPQCRQLEADIKAGQIPAGVTIFKVDYDSNQDLRQKYGVTIQTTLVRVDDDGNEIKKYVAYDSPTLAAITANLLP